MTRSPAPVWKWLLLALIAHSFAYMGVYMYHAATEPMSYGGDYLAFWQSASVLAGGGGAREIYDTSTLQQLLADQPVVSEKGLAAFPYPPVMLPFILPFGFVSFGCSLVAWLLLTGLAYYSAVRCSREWENLRRAPVAVSALLLGVFVIASPFALYNGVTGQGGFLIAALLIAGLNALPRAPVRAGMAFGLLCIKPQLMLMLPVFLIARRQWRCVFAGVVTAALLVALTTCWLGADSWAYFRQYVTIFTQAMEHIPQMPMRLNASLYRVLVIRGIDRDVALAVQALFAIFAAASLWFACRKSNDDTLCHALLVSAIFLAMPYIRIYDMTLCIVPALYLLKGIARGEEREGEWLGFVLLLTSPIIAHALPEIPVVFLSMLYCHVLLLRRVIRRPS